MPMVLDLTKQQYEELTSGFCAKAIYRIANWMAHSVTSVERSKDGLVMRRSDWEKAGEHLLIRFDGTEQMMHNAD